MPVPYTFANKSGALPLQELDANFASIPTLADTANTVISPAQANITSVGVLNSLSVNGTTTLTYASVSGNVVVGSGSYFLGNGSQLTGLYNNTNVSTWLSSGGLTSNILTTANISAGGNVYGNNITSLTGAVSNLTISTTGITANVNSLSTSLTGVTNIVANNSSNIATLQSQVYTNANVIGLGQSGWGGNIIPNGNNVYSLGNINNQWAELFVSNTTIWINGIPLSSATVSSIPTLLYNNAPIVTSGPAAAPITTNITTSANISASSLIGNNISISVGGTIGNVSVFGDNINIPDYVSAGGNVYGSNFIGNGSGLTTLTGANITGAVANAIYATTAGTAATVTTNAQPNITSTGVLSSLSVTGNTLLNGSLIVTGNANVQGNLTYNNVTNLTTDNLVVGLGNNQSGINVTGGGMIVGNTAEAKFLYCQPAQTWNSDIGISAVGNITANYFVGNGSLLTNINVGNITGNIVNTVKAGTGIAVSTTTGNPTITNTGVTSVSAGTGISLNTGTGNPTITNTGVTAVAAGTGISLNTTTGTPTITNSGVTSVVAGTGITVSGSSGAVTISTSGGAGSGLGGQVFTGNGTFTIPAGITSVKVTVVGGGGGGGGATFFCSPTNSGAGGGGGGAAISYLTGLTPGNTLSVAVGGGGGGGDAAGNPAGTGGTSSVSSGSQGISTISASGGYGAPGSLNDYKGGAGGIGSGGHMNIGGSAGQPLNAAESVGSVGGSSILGGGGNGGSNAVSPSPGRSYGGGGGGAGVAGNPPESGAAGAAGVVIFEW